jgi:predicted HTH transcriptional regulator
MRQASSQTRDTAQRLVVIDLLGQTRGRTRSTLYRHLRGQDHETIDTAIAGLVDAGVLAANGDRVRATAALACLESLDLIAI